MPNLIDFPFIICPSFLSFWHIICLCLSLFVWLHSSHCAALTTAKGQQLPPSTQSHTVYTCKYLTPSFNNLLTALAVQVSDYLTYLYHLFFFFSFLINIPSGLLSQLRAAGEVCSIRWRHEAGAAQSQVAPGEDKEEGWGCLETENPHYTLSSIRPSISLLKGTCLRFEFTILFPVQKTSVT